MKTIQKLFSSPYPTLFWVITILVLTLTPAADMPETPAWKLLSFDTAAHAGVFALLALLAYPWVQTWAVRPRLLVLLGGVALGGLIEVLQYAMHLGRQAEWSDLLSDSIGVVLALLLIGVGRRRLAAPAGLLLVAALGATAQPATRTAPTAPDLARARHTIEELAAPNMHGRGYVRSGEHLAAAYLRGRLRQLGLAPLAPDYTQPFALDVNTFPGKLALRLTSVDQSFSTLSFVPGVDFIASPESPSVVAQACALIPADTTALGAGDAKAHELLAGYLASQPNQILVLSQRAETQLMAPDNADLLAHWGKCTERVSFWLIS